MIAPVLPDRNGPGEPRRIDLRRVWNAIRYLAATGRAWSLSRHDFPPVSTVRTPLTNSYSVVPTGPGLRSPTQPGFFLPEYLTRIGVKIQSVGNRRTTTVGKVDRLVSMAGRLHPTTHVAEVAFGAAALRD